MQDLRAELVQAAARGDRHAAGEYFTQNLRVLGTVARRLAGGVVDADDLLSHAILSLLEKWANGGGPEKHVNAYIVQSMRNRIKDELKSPRSRVVYLEQEDIAADLQPEMRRADLQRELHLVRQALMSLPSDQRAVLTATVVDGNKPRDLETALSRPAVAIHSLMHRARLNLRRALLKLMLEEGAPAECRAAAQRLPGAIAATPEESGASRSADHYLTCHRCRKAWAGFAAISHSLSVISLVVLGEVLLARPTSAQADESTDASEETRINPQEEHDDSGESGATGSSSKAWRWTSASRGFAVSSVATAVGLIVSMVGLIYLWAPEQVWFGSQPTAQFDVTETVRTATSINFDIDFGVYGEDWRVSELSMRFDRSVTGVSAPEGWRCEAEDNQATCTTPLTNPRAGTFTVTFGPAAGDSECRFILTAETTSGVTVVGTFVSRPR